MARYGPDPIPEERCIQGLEEALDELGRPPSIREYRALDVEPDASTLKYRFGSWNQAKEAAGMDTNTASFDANDEYFKQINTSEKAYWLGFIWADGGVDHQDKTKITSRDVPHLEKFLDAIDAEHSVYEHGDTPNVALRRPAFTKHLRTHGLAEDKTYTDTLPELEGWAWPHFTRGIFDGDGYVRRSGERELTISHSEERLRRLNKHIPVQASFYNGHGKNTGRIAFHGERMERMIDWMYPKDGETEPKLERKAAIALQKGEIHQ